MEPKETTTQIPPVLDLGKLTSLIHKHALKHDVEATETSTAIEHLRTLKSYFEEHAIAEIGIVRKLYPAIMYYVRNSDDTKQEKDSVQIYFDELINNAKLEYHYQPSCNIIYNAITEMIEEYDEANRRNMQ